MKTFFAKVDTFLGTSLGLRPRGLLLLATLCVLPTYLAPLWDMTMFAPQYPDGLRLHIWSYRLDGGNGGQDVKEINLLNHYIGMRDLETADFSEFKWMPFVLGALGLLFLRAAVLGRMSELVDVVVLFFYFGLFSLWSFAYKMWSYGHHLAPTRRGPGRPVHASLVRRPEARELRGLLVSRPGFVRPLRGGRAASARLVPRLA